MKYFLLIAMLGMTAVGAFAQKNEPQTVDRVDLNRYAGRWYEIARYPNRFEKKCARNVTAEYVLKPKGRIQVINTCEKASGEKNIAEGEAKIDDKVTNSKLKVRFAPSFISWLPMVWGEYWILDLDKDYRYAVVGDSGRDYFWILSREPKMSERLYAELLQKAKAQGFDPGRVVRTEQRW